jgi:hypothetical protein
MDEWNDAQEQNQAKPTSPRPRNFHELPTEIHHLIAPHLPDHALHILARYAYNGRIRQIYQKADPTRIRHNMKTVSKLESSIFEELRIRDDLEKALRSCERLSPFHHAQLSRGRLHCASCQTSVSYAHFHLEEIKKSVNEREGMSKITERICRARTTPVRLWDDKVITWDLLQQAWAVMCNHMVPLPVLLDYAYTFCNDTKPPTKQPKRLTDMPNTLKIGRFDHFGARHLQDHHSHSSRIEAVAEYYIDLGILLRYRSLRGDMLAALIKDKTPYMCPHIDVAELLMMPLSKNPINFYHHDPAHDPNATVAVVLCKLMETSEWEPDWGHISSRRGDKKRSRLIKHRTLWCGFDNQNCRTAVSLQRFRDDSPQSTVGSPWWMWDLIRLKVTRVWRIDTGTGEKEWQAQNGVSSKGRVCKEMK